MIKTGIKEARQRLTGLLRKAEKGEEIVITKRGEPIASICAIRTQPKRKLVSRKSLRGSIKPKGKALSVLVQESRSEERF